VSEESSVEWPSAKGAQGNARAEQPQEKSGDTGLAPAVTAFDAAGGAGSAAVLA